MNCRSKGMLLGILPSVTILLGVTIALSAARVSAQAPQTPSMIAVSGGVPIAVLHAEGAQIYQCESDSHDQLIWQPREPIASLILDGDTVGRHYAGLHWGHIDYARFQWEHADGSAVQARIAASAAAASPDDIPWLRLEVTRQTGNGAPQNRDREIAQSRAPMSQLPNLPSPISSGTHLTLLFSLTSF